MVRFTFLSPAIIIVAIPVNVLAGCGYGPDTCIAGYVWRDAFPGDHICVTPDQRDWAKSDNAAAFNRKQPGGGGYGPDTCISGYVWREANATDHVCVLPSIRSRVQLDNAQHPFHVVCSCTVPFVMQTQRWFGTAPICNGDCPDGWTAIRRAGSGDGCEKSRKGVCVTCTSIFGIGCWSGTKVLCRENIESGTQS